MSQKLTSELKESNLRSSNIFVTNVVHRLAVPVNIMFVYMALDIVELLTAVYVTPLIESVSPTVALGH